MLNFREEAEQIEDYIIEQRRYFHRHPELSFEEKETTKVIGKQLEAIGLTPFYFDGYYGVWTMIEGGKATKERKTIALRADIDALPIFLFYR
jgi:metal-dependent amidase/aminoacylase/carboxypeptidase family protein